MACNCATQEQLNELYKKYGRKVEPDARTTWGFRIKKFVNDFFLIITMVIIVPFIFCYVMGKGLFTKEKKISLKKFFRLDNNNRLNDVLNSEFVNNIQRGNVGE